MDIMNKISRQCALIRQVEIKLRKQAQVHQLRVEIKVFSYRVNDKRECLQLRVIKLV